MKDYEIIMWLKELTPESEEQAKAIRAAENAFYRALKFEPDSNIREFLEAYDKEQIINKSSSELYEEYLEYCNDFDYTEASHSLFTRTVKFMLDLHIKVIKIDGKATRVYRA